MHLTKSNKFTNKFGQVLRVTITKYAITKSNPKIHISCCMFKSLSTNPQRALLCALDLLYLGVTIEISAPGGGTTGPPATIIKVATKILKFIFHAVCLKAYPQRPEILKFIFCHSLFETLSTNPQIRQILKFIFHAVCLKAYPQIHN